MTYSGNVRALPGPLLVTTAKNERDADTFAALRDALLPKLISGEIRVSVR